MTVRTAVALAGLCLAAGVARAQDVQIVLRGGDPVPGVDGTVDLLLKLEMNNAGQIVLRGSTTAALDDFVAVATHTPFAMTETIAEGDAVAGEPTLVYQRTLTQLVDINDAGQFVFADGGATAGPATAYRDGVIVARQGDLIGAEIINDIDQVQVDAAGNVYYLADIGDNSDADQTLVRGTTILLREGDMISGVPILGIAPSESTSGAKLSVNEAGDWIVEVDRDNSSNLSTFPDKNVIFNGQNILGEGDIEPAIGDHNFFPVIGVTESGEWFVVSRFCTLDGCDLVEALIREGTIIAQTFDDLGGGLTIDRFQIADMNSRGDWIASIDVHGAPDTATDEVLVINGQVVLREGDPVPGEAGMVWTGGFGQVRDMAIDDSGRFAFVSGMRPAGGGSTIDVLVVGSIDSGCVCEMDGNAAQVDVFDLLAYLDLWFAGDAAAELDGAAGVDVFDLLAFLDCWFPASAGAC